MYRLPPLSQLGPVLEIAVGIDHASGGAIHARTDRGRRLRLLEARGLPDEYFERYRLIGSDPSTSYAQAFVERRRVVIRDVDSDPAYAPERRYAESAGFRAVQSTPLIDRDRQLHGLLTTYFGRPHHPEPSSLHELDRCARVATLILQCHALHDAYIAANRHLGLQPTELGPEAAQAAEAARRLLPALGATDPRSGLDIAARNLELVVAQIEARLRQSGAAFPAG